MPKITNKSRQYLFKNKLNKRRKSKTELIKESFLMILFGLFLLIVNYLIPEKMKFFNSFKKNIFEVFNNVLEIFFYSLEIFTVLFIIFTILLSLFLFAGSVNRIIKVVRTKSRRLSIRKN